jgi:hypothetical protein
MIESSISNKVGLLLCLLVSFNNLSLSQTKAWIASSSCSNYLYISGESNINQFSFRYDKVTLQGKLNSTSGNSEALEISIPIKDFEASNPLMYNDFLVLMKESEYHIIKVSFSKKQIQNAWEDITATCPDISISIAGITRFYKIHCSAAKCSDNLYLRGEKIIKLSDFHLKPPAKLFGLVKVNDEISVNFGFIITFTGDNQLSAIL